MGALTLPLNTIVANLGAESCLHSLLSPHHQEHSVPGKGQVQLISFDHSQSVIQSIVPAFVRCPTPPPHTDFSLPEL